MDVERLLRQSIDRRRAANGLAIIIANEEGYGRDHKRLEGAEKDLKAMKETFEILRFATLPIFNATKEQILSAVQAAANYKAYPPSYKRIAFVFSGHGDESHIYCHDGSIRTNLIYEPLQPINAPHLADIPKLFFIDACRGTMQDKGVVARGPTVYPRKPSYGNYVLAYSTMPSMQAYETAGDGGLWMHTLSKQLRNKRKSILDVLTDVNTELLEVFRLRQYETLQQPVLESTLHEPVNLLKEAEEIGKDLEVKLNFPPYDEIQEILDGKQGSSYRSVASATPVMALHTYTGHSPTMPNSVNASQQKKPGMAPVFMGTALLEQQQCTLQQQPQRPYGAATALPFSSGACATIPQLQHPKTSVIPQTHQHPAAVNPQPTASKCTPPSVGDHHSLLQASSVHTSILQPSHHQGQFTDGKPPGHYRGVLNHYAQTGVIQSFDYHDKEQYDNASMQMSFQCSVSVTLLNDQRTVVGSSQTAFPQKQKAREEAARNAVHQIKLLQSNRTHLQPGLGLPLCKLLEFRINEVVNGGIFTGSATPNYTESIMSEDARIQLNHFCQTNSVHPQFSFIEDASSGQRRYKCTITYRINGRPGRIDSPGYYASKGEAKEKAARILIEKETQVDVNAISSRGHSPTAKIWKSKLKEYYDKSSRAGVQPDYVTKECPKDGYQCTLFSPEIGYIRGDIGRSKSEAEHSTAYKALQKLKQL